jgi:hypothetical protein
MRVDAGDRRRSGSVKHSAERFLRTFPVGDGANLPEADVMRIMRVLLLVALAGLAPVQARAEAPTVSLVASDPGLSRELGRGVALYLRLAYRSETPLRVQVKGFNDGEEVRDGVRWNPSPAYPAGEGEALVWIAYGEPVRIDELRIEVSDADWRPLGIVSVPARLGWTAKRIAEPQRAAWVAPMSAAQQEAFTSSASADPGVAWGIGIALALMLGVPGYFVLQVVLARRWSGGWRIAALAPLLVMGPAVVHTLVALAAGSNLWPIVIIFAAPPALACLLAMVVARTIAGALATS